MLTQPIVVVRFYTLMVTRCATKNQKLFAPLQRTIEMNLHTTTQGTAMTDKRQREKCQSFTLNKERIATQCACCGSKNLKSSPAFLMPFVAHRTFGWEPVVIDESCGLATIKPGNAYSICKSLYCNDCGFLFLDIRFSDIELSNLYRDYRGIEYNSLRESYEPGYTKRNDNLNAGIGYIEDIEKFLKPYLRFPITILDWGGDTGKNTPFKNNNEAFDIYDISNKDVLAGARVVIKKEAQQKIQAHSLFQCVGARALPFRFTNRYNQSNGQGISALH
jgi:hypothetical protein